jgi:hypothetical protein
MHTRLQASLRLLNMLHNATDVEKAWTKQEFDQHGSRKAPGASSSAA